MLDGFTNTKKPEKIYRIFDGFSSVFLLYVENPVMCRDSRVFNDFLTMVFTEVFSRLGKKWARR